jgi:hypothetical protein
LPASFGLPLVWMLSFTAVVYQDCLNLSTILKFDEHFDGPIDL